MRSSNHAYQDDLVTPAIIILGLRKDIERLKEIINKLLKEKDDTL